VSLAALACLELLIVVAIVIILAATAIPTFLTAYYNTRLKSAVSDISGFMQTARIRAARQNTTYTIQYRPTGATEEAYLDLINTGVFQNGDPELSRDPAWSCGRSLVRSESDKWQS
jgi:Tfp pilus assembly protein FimT